MKYLIIGAGPSGLSFAHRLRELGEKDFLILEKENEAGGLCRSTAVCGFPLDIGGGHFLEAKNERATGLLFKYLKKEEWLFYERDSRIFINGRYIGSPIEANIWQMSREDQVEYLKSIAIAGCNLGTPMPEKFVDWIYWKLGKKIAEDYMLPYNRKMFGKELDLLGTYWLNKLPNVSFEETLISCLERKAYGKQPGHSSFYYPEVFGYGEAFKRMGEDFGDKLKTGVEVSELDIEERTVNGEYKAEYIINTAPWTSFKKIKGLPKELSGRIKELRHSSVVIEHVDGRIDNPAYWIYYPDESLSYHRILVRHNFLPGASGYWTETNLDRYDRTGKKEGGYFINEYAYPLNTIGKNEAVGALLEYLEKRGIFGLGRWGEWQHYNSDVVIERGMDLAGKLF